MACSAWPRSHCCTIALLGSHISVAAELRGWPTVNWTTCDWAAGRLGATERLGDDGETGRMVDWDDQVTGRLENWRLTEAASEMGRLWGSMGQ